MDFVLRFLRLYFFKPTSSWFPADLTEREAQGDSVFTQNLKVRSKISSEQRSPIDEYRVGEDPTT